MKFETKNWSKNFVLFSFILPKKKKTTVFAYYTYGAIHCSNTIVVVVTVANETG